MMITIKELLQRAIEQGASDVHITAENPPQMRVNGRLICLEDLILSAEDGKEMLFALLNEKQKKQLEETGTVVFAFSFMQTRCRGQIFRHIQGYAAAFRLFGNGIPEAEALSIPQSVLELSREKQGLVIISGASGSGRTTTVSVLLEQINREAGGHILTLESPVEYQYTEGNGMINQREVGTDIVSYQAGLYAALREDVDVIAVGEIPDAETVLAMITTAEMGHLVFGVMDAVGAVETVEKMVELFSPERQQAVRIRLARVLRAVISQQLIPTLGNERRQGVFDVMYVDGTVKNLICEGKTAQIGALMQAENGMQRMEEGIFELYIRGEIDRRQALQYVWDSSLLEKKLI